MSQTIAHETENFDPRGAGGPNMIPEETDPAVRPRGSLLPLGENGAKQKKKLQRRPGVTYTAHAEERAVRWGGSSKAREKQRAGEARWLRSASVQNQAKSPRRREAATALQGAYTKELED